MKTWTEKKLNLIILFVNSYYNYILINKILVLESSLILKQLVRKVKQLSRQI